MSFREHPEKPICRGLRLNLGLSSDHEQLNSFTLSAISLNVIRRFPSINAFIVP